MVYESLTMDLLGWLLTNLNHIRMNEQIQLAARPTNLSYFQEIRRRVWHRFFQLIQTMPSLLNLRPFPNFITDTHFRSIPFCTKSFSNFAPTPSRLPVSSKAYSQDSKSSLSFLSPLEAILFDIDGTLCDSDPIHFDAFRIMLQEIGFNGGTPIDEEYFIKNISGKHNDELCGVLLPDWEFEKAIKFMVDKEAFFRRLASEQLGPMNGLKKLCKWVDDHGLKRAAVTNAPRSNAELLISMLGLVDFFEIVVLAEECARAKPFPDPYLKALDSLEASPKHTLVFEDSVSGIKAAKAAGMAVVGLGTRNPEKLLLDAGASFVIKDYDDPQLWNNLEKLVMSVELNR